MDLTVSNQILALISLGRTARMIFRLFHFPPGACLPITNYNIMNNDTKRKPNIFVVQYCCSDGVFTCFLFFIIIIIYYIFFSFRTERRWPPERSGILWERTKIFPVGPITFYIVLFHISPTRVIICNIIIYYIIALCVQGGPCCSRRAPVYAFYTAFEWVGSRGK